MASKAQKLGFKRIEMPAPPAGAFFIPGVDTDCDETHPCFDPGRELSSDEMRDSIAQHGVMQNVLARFVGDRLEVICGARRVFNARRVSPDTPVPVSIREMTDAEAIAAKQTENCQRRDDKPISMARRAERMKRIFKMTTAQIAEASGVQVRAVERWLKALTAHPDVLQAVDNGIISLRAAATLAGEDPETQRAKLAAAVAAGATSINGIAATVRAGDDADPAEDDAAPEKSRPAKATGWKPPTIPDVRRMLALAEENSKLRPSAVVLSTLRWLVGEVNDRDVPTLARLRKAMEKERAQ